MEGIIDEVESNNNTEHYCNNHNKFYASDETFMEQRAIFLHHVINNFITQIKQSGIIHTCGARLFDLKYSAISGNGFFVAAVHEIFKSAQFPTAAFVLTTLLIIEGGIDFSFPNK
ncbi:CLUMA_CG005100, isoform A [Clunio marinus]|uniref:CLUMA_CG005100, isoform A n=1 Tax=Clunio marinus TaxID=568069 RepID=A0A1J1HVN8_9DIPT|nr:CLUMA_CG005100, isoform A [Clunio marinus]